MAYCRWSDDGYQSDVYVYQNVEGMYVIWVAMYRLEGVENMPKNPELEHEFWYGEEDMSPNRINQFKALTKARHEFIQSCRNVRIGKEYDGKYFEFHTIKELIEKLKDIKSKGYRVPDWLFESLEKEGEG